MEAIPNWVAAIGGAVTGVVLVILPLWKKINSTRIEIRKEMRVDRAEERKEERREETESRNEITRQLDDLLKQHIACEKDRATATARLAVAEDRIKTLCQEVNDLSTQVAALKRRGGAR